MLYMKRQFKLHRLMDGADDGKGGGDGGASGNDGAGDGGGGDGAGAKGAGSGGDGKGAGDPAAAWSDFVTKYAGDDASKKGMLSRYANFEALADAQMAIRQRISKGEIKTVLPKDATEEQVKTWREENGIPASPDKYDITPKEGKISEADKAVIGKYLLGRAHATNMTPAQATATVDAFREFVADTASNRAMEDTKQHDAAINKLTADWGTAYKPNMSQITGLLDTLPKAVRDRFEHGRLADGTAIMNDPDFLKAMHQWAREINPVSTIVPNAGGDLAGSIEIELAAIKKVMSTNRKAYNKDEKMQARYLELINAQQRVKGKK